MTLEEFEKAIAEEKGYIAIDTRNARKLLAVLKAAKETFERQTDYQAKWAMEDIQKALAELEKE